ncbi:MAG: hypothetical protein ACREIA_23275 [Opitutaceae bacterium]
MIPDDREVASGITRTYGAVGHVFPWLSLFYNKSTNFALPNTSITLFPVYKTPPNPTGDGEDYGIKLDILENRVYATLTYYETTAKSDAANTGRFFEKTTNNILEEFAERGIITDAERDAQTANTNGYSFDSKSKGTELEIIANLTSSWRLSLSASKNETSLSNVATEVIKFYDDNIDFGSSGNRPLFLINADLDGIADPLNDPSTLSTAPGGIDREDGSSNTIGEQIAAYKREMDRRFVAQEGTLRRGQRKYQASMFTSYSFHEGPMDGFSIGGGFRYDDALSAGETDLPA